VTGVQTCALPIYERLFVNRYGAGRALQARPLCRGGGQRRCRAWRRRTSRRTASGTRLPYILSLLKILSEPEFEGGRRDRSHRDSDRSSSMISTAQPPECLGLGDLNIFIQKLLYYRSSRFALDLVEL